MKKNIFLLTVLMFCYFASFSQTAEIIASQYKEIKKVDGVWQKWSSEWLYYEEQGHHEPEVKIKRLATNPYIYEIRYYVDGKLAESMNVTYNADQTKKKRVQW